MKPDLDAIDREMPGIPRDAEGPVFKAPWEAQAFAMAVALHERGAFTWKEWAACLAEVIAEQGPPDGRSSRAAPPRMGRGGPAHAARPTHPARVGRRRYRTPSIATIARWISPSRFIMLFRIV
jgi:hypothetical protein